MEIIFKDPKIVAAIVVAVFSLIVSIFSAVWNRESLKRIEQLKSKMAEQKAVKDARLDYEYEARKRLYQECEPIFFQLNEASQDTIHRVISLARTSRVGKLGLKEGAWLAKEGYYSISTLYNLLVPLAHYKLIKQALTLVDLNVDPIIRARYELLKRLYVSWTDDFEFARFKPSLNYNPNIQAWREARMDKPELYWRQGLPIGRLDGAVESLLMKWGDEGACVKSFGQFESEYKISDSETRRSFDIVNDIIHGFDPVARPVLWRCLLTQVLLCRAIVRSCETPPDTKLDTFKPILPFSDDDMAHFDWRKNTDKIDDAIVRNEFNVAYEYLNFHLPDLCNGKYNTDN